MENKFAERLTGVDGSATREIFKLLANPAIISFAGGNPAPESFPKKDLADFAADILMKSGETVLQYGTTRGIKPLIGEIIKLAEADGIKAAEENVLVISGSSQGIELMAKSFINKGDTILVESPTFVGALQTFKTFQPNMVAVDTDDGGILLDDLEKKIKQHQPKFLYVIPTFQNPSGVTLVADRRKKLVEICAANGVKVLEDDPYASLRYSGEPLKPLKSFDTDGTVIRLMSFSKTISPGLRVGAAIGDAEIIRKFEICKQGIDVHTNNLAQAMVYEYIHSGKFQPHIEEIKAAYKQKRDVMREMIAEYFPKNVKVSPCDGGLFLWLTLPEGINTLDLLKTAVTQNVAFVPGTHFFAHGGHDNTLRLNFSMVSEAKIREGIKTLGGVITESL